MSDETYRRFHSGRYTDRPEGTEWKLRDSYRENREANAASTREVAKIIKNKEEHPDKMAVPGKQEYKRKDM